MFIQIKGIGNNSCSIINTQYIVQLSEGYTATNGDVINATLILLNGYGSSDKHIELDETEYTKIAHLLLIGKSF